MEHRCLLPRPDNFTWLCAGILSVPGVVFVVVGLALMLGSENPLTEPSNFDAAAILGKSLPLLVVDYFAIIRRSQWATSVVASIESETALQHPEQNSLRARPRLV